MNPEPDNTDPSNKDALLTTSDTLQRWKRMLADRPDHYEPAILIAGPDDLIHFCLERARPGEIEECRKWLSIVQDLHDDAGSGYPDQLALQSCLTGRTHEFAVRMNEAYGWTTDLDLIRYELREQNGNKWAVPTLYTIKLGRFVLHRIKTSTWPPDPVSFYGDRRWLEKHDPGSMMNADVSELERRMVARHPSIPIIDYDTKFRGGYPTVKMDIDSIAVSRELKGQIDEAGYLVDKHGVLIEPPSEEINDVAQHAFDEGRRFQKQHSDL